MAVLNIMFMGPLAPRPAEAGAAGLPLDFGLEGKNVWSVKTAAAAGAFVVPLAPRPVKAGAAGLPHNFGCE